MSFYTEVVGYLAPVAYWRLGEASGTVAADERGLYPGTYVNAPTLGVAGGITGDTNTGVTFVPASTTYMNVPHASGINITGDLTICAWVYCPSNQSNYAAILSKRTSSVATPYTFHFRSTTNTLGFAYTNAAGTTWYDDANGGVVPTGQWAFVAVVREPNVPRVTYYVNGVAKAGGTPTFTGAYAGNTQDMRSGNNVVIAANGLSATVDEVAIWNRALTAAEVAALYTAGHDPSTPFITGGSAPTGGTAIASRPIGTAVALVPKGR